MSQSRQIGRFMRATEMGPGWGVHTNGGDPLGAIRWFAKWKQHEFVPLQGTIFTCDCLAPLAEFLAALDKERRSAT